MGGGDLVGADSLVTKCAVSRRPHRLSQDVHAHCCSLPVSTHQGEGCSHQTARLPAPTGAPQVDSTVRLQETWGMGRPPAASSPVLPTNISQTHSTRGPPHSLSSPGLWYPLWGCVEQTQNLPSVKWDNTNPALPAGQLEKSLMYVTSAEPSNKCSSMT